MSQHQEKDFILPALRVIKQHGSCDMSTIKNEIDKFIVLSNEDKIKSLTRNEAKYRQIVGNLTSHRNKGLHKYIDVETIKGDEGKKSPKLLFKLNREGQKLLFNEDQDEILNLMDDAIEEQKIKSATVLDDETLSDLDNRPLDLKAKTVNSNRPKTEPQIAKTVLVKENYVCRYARLTNVKHITFDASVGHKYVEAHHLIPMKASKDFGINLDRSSNIVPLCPLCHAQVHHGTLEEKIKILKVLYDNAIPKLKKEGIFISFPDLINKYYNK